MKRTKYWLTDAQIDVLKHLVLDNFDPNGDDYFSLENDKESLSHWRALDQIDRKFGWRIPEHET